MPEKTVDISFPIKENILLSLKETKAEFAKEIRYLSALHFYRNRKLSLGKAAELAGYGRIEFIEKLRSEDEFIFDYSEDEIAEVFDDVDKIK